MHLPFRKQKQLIGYIVIDIRHPALRIGDRWMFYGRILINKLNWDNCRIFKSLLNRRFSIFAFKDFSIVQTLTYIAEPFIKLSHSFIKIKAATECDADYNNACGDLGN